MGLDEYRHAIDLTPYPRPALLSEEEKSEACDKLLRFLLREKGMIAAFSATYQKKRELIREAMSERPPLPIPPDILALQDSLFWTESVERDIVTPDSLTFGAYDIALWEGDITRLGVDAIVNSGNSSLVGCLIPGHNCIDNLIHSAAGMQLRADCRRIISALGHEEECGNARVTRAYNLPATFVFHTVGPRVGRELKDEHRAELRSCYISCLDLAEELRLKTIAFCCIGTGVFNFPSDAAAEIATGAVINWKLRRGYPVKVIFNTFNPADTAIYRTILGMM